MTRKSELQMAKKDNLNNNDPISKAVDLLLENIEDLTTMFKEGGLYKELTFNFQKNSWWNKKKHQPGLKFDFI
ncbi:hypothetical protein [Spiroplasma endosymbiont of Zeiraphera isertana]|uniref:hypothetical protein n=1 Tax=Spiroplasma endosymbiont of Zeiraphera isertana TaxID=3066313 RepID=UPI00313B7C66